MPQPPFDWIQVLNLITTVANWLANLVIQHTLTLAFVFVAFALVAYLPDIFVVLLLLVLIALGIKYFGSGSLPWNL